MKQHVAFATLLALAAPIDAAEVALQTPPLAGKPLLCSLVNATGASIEIKEMRILSISGGAELSASHSCKKAVVPDGSGCLVAKPASTGWGAWADGIPAYCRIVYSGAEQGVLAALQTYSDSGDISAAVSAVRVK